MKIQPTVLLQVTDERLRREAAAHLSGAGYHVRTAAAESPETPDLVVRDWRGEAWVAPPAVPVLTVDLSLVRGRDLDDLLVRVLGWRAPGGDHRGAPMSAHARQSR
jgi:hypothetical protein